MPDRCDFTASPSLPSNMAEEEKVSLQQKASWSVPESICYRASKKSIRLFVFVLFSKIQMK